MEMDIRISADPVRFQRMTSGEIRNNFLLDNLFQPDKVTLSYYLQDRAMVGSALPIKKSLQLEQPDGMSDSCFTERRETGIINVGSAGTVKVGDTSYTLEHFDVLYIGKGEWDVTFQSADAKNSAKFYFLAFPAQQSHPCAMATFKDAEAVHLGSQPDANKRTIYKMIYPENIPTSQLVMGYTVLEEGSIWNTMPAHTHLRRCEIYLYCDMDDDSLVFHFMGQPDETRHIVIRNEQAVYSPSWSMHSGAGLRRYMFVWAMGGENQEFTDMQGFPLDSLR